MRVALGLARRGLGSVAPNPAVGCVLVKDNIVVGRGWTQPGGRPHAETEALKQAGSAAKGATAYVTLEPCAHTGKTPPCAQALIRAGVSKVFVAHRDPDPRVSGRGTQQLTDAGIQVVDGLCGTEAAAVNIGFLTRTTRNRPTFTLKSATSLDGKIALASGESKWITGRSARLHGHRLRATHDAILVGVGTVLADGPSLTCRLAGVGNNNPIRIVLDSELKTPANAKVLNGDAPSILVTSSSDTTGRNYPSSVEVLSVANTRDVPLVAEQLAQRSINSVLIEGGAQVAASFLSACVIDRWEHFAAGKALGSTGIDAIGDIKLASLGDAPQFRLTCIKKVGADMLASYVKAE